MKTISVSAQRPSSDAGEINVELKDDHEGTIIVSGSHAISMGIDDKLSLFAVGGNGLDGKVGANGQNGAPGEDGRDATMYSSGSDGKPGKNGEHGEAGTHGGNAGNGGKIGIRVKQDDLALLDAISMINVSAGIPGKAGKHGAGGQGGKGGRGGSGYSWSEPYTVHHTEHSIDAHGNSHSHVVSQTHYHHHSSPGGKDGARGLPGGAYTYPLFPGAAGNDGEVNFHVVSEGMESVHKEPYKLVTQSVRFLSTEGSILWEPGDTVSAFYEVHNTGKTMISPPESMPLVLQQEDNLELVQTGDVAGGISAGTSHVCRQPLQFRINEPQSHDASEPYKRSADVIVGVQNTRLYQPFQNSWTKDVLTIQYPVLLEPQPTQFSIANNESCLLQATVQNIGNNILGEKAGRELFMEITAVETDSTLIAESVSQLAPQNKHQISYSEHFKTSAELGEHQAYHMNLYLQPIDRSQNKRLIQRQTIVGQLSPVYSPTQNKFTLVINFNTSKEQINYWTTFLSQLSGNPQLAIWNTSYYQQFNLEGTCNLLADTAHGTVIVLDDVFAKKDTNQLQHNTQHITQEQLLKASQHYDVSLVALGSNPLVKPFTNTDVVSWSDPLSTHDSIDALIANLMQENDVQSLSLHQVTLPLKQQWFFGAKEEAKDAISLLIDKLKQVFPNRTYHVNEVCANEAQVTVNVRRMADKLEQNIHQIVLSDEQIAHPENNHEIIESGILAALSFSQKLELFIQKSNPYHKQLAKAITKDLLEEHKQVMQTCAYGSWFSQIIQRNQRDFTLELKRLKQLVKLLEQFVQNGDFTNVQAWSPRVIRMIAQVQYHAKQQSSFWTRLIHWFFPLISEQILEATHSLCDEIFTIHSDHSTNSEEEIEATIQREEDIIHLTHKLKIFLQSNVEETHNTSFTFFSKSVLTSLEREAVEQLLRVCTEDAAYNTLDEYQSTLYQNPKLKKYSIEVERLFSNACYDDLSKLC